MERKRIQITVAPSGDGNHFDFTYAPTTAHFRPGDDVSFLLVRGAQALTLLFEHSPFQNGQIEIRVQVDKPSEDYAIGAQRGVYHYKAIGEAALPDERKVLAYDVWCPGIIVD